MTTKEHVARPRVPGLSVDPLVTYPLVNPHDGQRVGHSYECGFPEVDAAIAHARKAQREWVWMGPAARGVVLNKLADLVIQYRKLLERYDRTEGGKTTRQFNEGDLPFSVEVLRYFAAAGRSLHTTAAGEYTPGFQSKIRRDPVGIVAAILPWNYPLMMATWKLAAVTAAGNALILKPAEQTPGSACLLAGIAQEAGMPEGLVQVVTGHSHAGQALVSHPNVDMICLTGSPETGLAVLGDLSTGGMKRLHLELGGKAPMLVFKDSDPKDFLEGFIRGGFPNSGQSCTQTGRILMEDRIYEERLDDMAQAVSDLVVGDPSTPETDVGPLIDERQLRRVQGLVEDAIRRGATAFVGGKPLDGPGYYFEPTLLINTEPDWPINQEEVFGPVVTVTKCADYIDLIEMANDSAYGLAASVWTSNIETALRAEEDLRAGCVWINTTERLTPEMPHGGYGRSGFGNDLGQESLHDFTVAKHIMTKNGRLP